MTSEDAGAVWESQAEVDAVLSETGATMDKVRRWRRQGLLPKEIDWRPEAYHGSTVRYPKGTCAQLRAAAALFKKRNRVHYVGLRLWRLGFPVDEKYWHPRLRRAGWVADKAARILPGPERPKLDRAVLDFVKGHVFDPADFVIRTDGVCRLNPEMARIVVAKVSA